MTNSATDFAFEWAHVTWLEGDALIATSNGVLHSIVINYMDSKASFVVYDGIDATGTVLGIVTCNFAQPMTLLYDAEYVVGLYIGIAGLLDLTVNYK